MARSDYAVQQARIEREIQKLQKQADVLLQKQRKPIVQSIIRTISEYGITQEELAPAFEKAARRSAVKSADSTSTSAKKTAAPRVKRTVEPKYRHPETGDTWTGRGKAPRWITAAEAEGKQRDSFLIQK
ncbi:MAG: H-NS histone family protein [Corticimicrobacter sp.]|uniref:H-NS histone family protein n=1 Tax=Corticimicrobacter sp. TaxID=2678536 RepID=UPI0032DA3035